MNTESQSIPTLDEWRISTGDHARKVADMIDQVMSGNVSPNPLYTLKTLRIRLQMLDQFKLRPNDNAEFNEQIAILEAQEGGKINTDAIRSVAEFLSPSDQKAE